jgi:iron(III) transport system ATP-binding protein
VVEGISVQNISKRFGRDSVALHDLSFNVNSGEFVTLLGPSGCGKTTTLRSIAGLERPDSGRILIDGQEVFAAASGKFIAPEDRGLGMVFQSYAIWPHMTVFENVAYGLKARKRPNSEVRTRVREVLEMVGLADFGNRPATNLSGGQQQRVALARSLAGAPKVLLLDEPLSNLDAKLRERMRLELKQLQRKLGVTALYVTHDQTEALALSDRIIVMQAGRIVQQGDSKQIYKNPQNRFVIDFVGQANLIEGAVVHREPNARLVEIRTPFGFNIRGTISEGVGAQFAVGASATAAVRPENIHISQNKPLSMVNLWEAEIASDLFLGSTRELTLLASGQHLKAHVASEEEIPGSGRIWIAVAPESVRIFA